MRPTRWIMAALLICGCSAPVEDKLGAEGEGCLTDNDCQLAFLCIAEECSRGESQCDAICSRLNEDCEADLGGCIGTCAEATLNFSQERKDDVLSCVLDTSCRSLSSDPFGQCAAHNCDAVCQQLSDCGIETYDDCAASCDGTTKAWTRDEFADFQSCIDALACDEIATGSEACFPD